MGNQGNLRRGWVLALPLPSCSVSGKAHNLSLPQFWHL